MRTIRSSGHGGRLFGANFDSQTASAVATLAMIHHLPLTAPLMSPANEVTPRGAEDAASRFLMFVKLVDPSNNTRIEAAFPAWLSFVNGTYEYRGLFSCQTSSNPVPLSRDHAKFARDWRWDIIEGARALFALSDVLNSPAMVTVIHRMFPIPAAEDYRFTSIDFKKGVSRYNAGVVKNINLKIAHIINATNTLLRGPGVASQPFARCLMFSLMKDIEQYMDEALVYYTRDIDMTDLLWVHSKLRRDFPRLYRLLGPGTALDLIIFNYFKKVHIVDDYATFTDRWVQHKQCRLAMEDLLDYLHLKDDRGRFLPWVEHLHEVTGAWVGGEGAGARRRVNFYNQLCENFSSILCPQRLADVSAARLPDSPSVALNAVSEQAFARPDPPPRYSYVVLEQPPPGYQAAASLAPRVDPQPCAAPPPQPTQPPPPPGFVAAPSPGLGFLPSPMSYQSGDLENSLNPADVIPRSFSLSTAPEFSTNSTVLNPESLSSCAMFSASRNQLLGEQQAYTLGAVSRDTGNALTGIGDINEFV